MNGVKGEDLVPGDEIVIKLPCRVTVTKVTEPGDGSPSVGNLQVEYTDAEVLDGAGEYRVGSMVAIDRIGHYPGWD